MGWAAAAVVVGAVVGAVGQHQQGQAADLAAKSEAMQRERNAKQTAAAGRRRAAEIRRQGRVRHGDARAAMAAMGGVADDVGALDQLDNLDAVSQYNALASIYESDVNADQQNYEANMARFEGRTARKAASMQAAGTVMQGVASGMGMKARLDAPAVQ